MPARDRLAFARLIAPTLAHAGVGLAVDTAKAPLARRAVTSDVARTDYDPLDPRIAAQPHRYYREMLAGHPVHYAPRRNLWVISHFDAVKAALKDTDSFSHAQGIVRYRTSLPTMLTVDEPRHAQFRKLGIPSFTSQNMRAWDETMASLADEMVANLHANPGSDAVDELAIPLPVKMIAMILGVPPEDYKDFRTWSDRMVQLANVDLRLSTLPRLTEIVGATGNLYAYFAQRFRSGALASGDTALSRAIAASDDGALDAKDLFFFASLLLLAGNETTTNMLGTLFHNLAENPDQFDRVRKNRDLIPNAIEEQVRHSSPIQGFYRTTLTPVTIDGTTIPEGARVLLSFAAANRDPRRFDNPDQFRVERDTAQHLGFGHGVHLCLGMRLARGEGISVLRALCETTSRIDITGTPRWTTNGSLRGLAHLPVRLEAA